ncbi:MAG: PilZ domain-containing protein [Spirochaetaceae bacterium]|nr:PilZ domain-containing protein [Spirochaetaceae bacterium]
MQNEVIAELIQQEYEVYIARDHQNLRKILKRYPDSIVLVNIDDRMSEGDWEAWIRNLMAEPAIAAVKIGILSANNDEVLQRKYINSVKVQCGYTVIKSDTGKSVKQIMDILKTVNAKGRRKYIRATSENEALTTINLPHNGTYINGVIKDISVVGLSCVFSEDPELEKNSLCPNIQVKLQSMLLKAEGIVFGSRMDGLDKIYVILFTQRIDPIVRTKIRRYIQSNLQAKMDEAFK